MIYMATYDDDFTMHFSILKFIFNFSFQIPMKKTNTQAI